jgi:SsrA-binding protein
MKKDESNYQVVANNRKASFNYFLLEFIEAGIVLLGSEVKSLRLGKGNIAESYAVDSGGELFLQNSYIPEYRQSSYNNHDPRRLRKLLLSKKQINKILGKINQDGLTVVPVKMYFNHKGIAKVQIAIAKGKKQFDKRHSKKAKDWEREKSRVFRKG